MYRLLGAASNSIYHWVIGGKQCRLNDGQRTIDEIRLHDSKEIRLHNLSCWGNGFSSSCPQGHFFCRCYSLWSVQICVCNLEVMVHTNPLLLTLILVLYPVRSSLVSERWVERRSNKSSKVERRKIWTNPTVRMGLFFHWRIWKLPSTSFYTFIWEEI